MIVVDLALLKSTQTLSTFCAGGTVSLKFSDGAGSITQPYSSPTAWLVKGLAMRD